MQPIKSQTRVPSEPIAYRIDDWCQIAGIGRSTTYELIKKGKLKAVKAGGRTLIPADQREKLLNGELA